MGTTTTTTPDSTLSHRLTLTHTTINNHRLPTTTTTDRLTTTDTDNVPVTTGDRVLTTATTDRVHNTTTVERVRTVTTATTTTDGRQARTCLWRSRDLGKARDKGEQGSLLLGQIKRSPGSHDGSLLRDRLEEEERREGIERRREGEDIITRI